MRTGGAGGTCAQGPDCGRWKSFEKIFFSEKSKNTRACALAAPGTCAQVPDCGRWKSFEKKRISEKSKNTRACALAAPGGRARNMARTAEDPKFQKKNFFTKSRIMVAHAHWRRREGRARRARTAEDGKVSKKIFFLNKSKNTRVMRTGGAGDVRAGPGLRKMEKFRNGRKEFPKSRKILAACALAAPWGTCAQGPDRGRWKSLKKKKFPKCR